MIKLLATLVIFVAVMISDDGKTTEEYVVFDNNVSDSLFIGVYGKGHVQRFRDSLSKNMSLMVYLQKEEQYSGLYMGLKKPVDLSETSDKYLSFRIKGAEGKENIAVSLKDTKKDIPDDIDLQVGRKISDFANITKQWQEVIIPLDSFPVKGENWNHKGKNGKFPLTGPFDWSDVNSFSFSKPDSADYTFYIDDVKIVTKLN